MKPTQRLILLTVVLPLAVAGLATALIMAPGSVDGVYYRFTSAGCVGDQFMEMRDSRVVDYVMCSPQTFLQSYYQAEPSGSVVFTFASGSDNKPWARAEPHLLGTRFFYLSDGKSEWKWKRFVTKAMMDHMVSVRITGVFLENEGTRITTYDSKFNVLDSTLRSKRGGSPGPASPP